jgi:hypothetical protein
MPPFKVPHTTTDEQVTELAKKFLPIRLKGNKAFLLEHKADLFNQSYTWDAKEKPYKGDLYVLDRLWTVHTFGYQGFFKPSIAEVIQQIPRCYDKLKVLYFEIIAPEDASDLNLWIEHIHAGVHVAKTNLYVPEPSSQLMAGYWHENRDMLHMHGANDMTPAQFAIEWIERLRAEDRLEVLDAMTVYDPKTGQPKKA